MKTSFHFFTISLLLCLPITASNSDSLERSLSKYENISTLTTNDIRILKHMREEEKLARDVYDYFYIKYDMPIFNNISDAEQRHMDRVLSLLTDNGIKDPASVEPGIFNNIALQELYNNLISQGNKSIVEALKVGASIEDVDIKDLMDFSKETNNASILNIFEDLTCGSRNHMRAFIRVLKTYDVSYKPQYISEVLFNEIISGNHEKCGRQNGNQMRNKKAKGAGNGMGRGRGNGMGKGSRNRGNRY